MKPTGLISVLVGSLAFGSLACDTIDRLTATHIKEIVDHPRKYEEKEVTIYGTVTDATSMVVVKYFEIQDDTGTIKVVTDRVLPAKGEKIKVTGHTSVIEVGSDRWVVLREKSRTDKTQGKGARVVRIVSLPRVQDFTLGWQHYGFVPKIDGDGHGFGCLNRLKQRAADSLEFGALASLNPRLTPCPLATSSAAILHAGRALPA